MDGAPGSDAYMAERLEHLGIVAGVCREIGLAEWLDAQDEHSHERVGVGTATLAMAALSEDENPLTARERAVLIATAGGASVAEIAARLSLSEGTVRNYLSVAIQKLSARNRVEAAQIAEHKGWL